MVGRLGPKDHRRPEDAGGFGCGAGGRFARRGSEGAAAERRNAQERLYSLDLDRVLAGECCSRLSSRPDAPHRMPTDTSADIPQQNDVGR